MGWFGRPWFSADDDEDEIWFKVSDRPPPRYILINTKKESPDKTILAPLIRKDKGWWSLYQQEYVDWTPTHWRYVE